MFNVTKLIAEIKLPCPVAHRALISIEICPNIFTTPLGVECEDIL
jgi:hypothetical protein